MVYGRHYCTMVYCTCIGDLCKTTLLELKERTSIVLNIKNIAMKLHPSHWYISCYYYDLYVSAFNYVIDFDGLETALGIRGVFANPKNTRCSLGSFGGHGNQNH